MFVGLPNALRAQQIQTKDQVLAQDCIDLTEVVRIVRLQPEARVRTYF